MVKFGIQVPAGREGIYIPSGFSTPDQLISLFIQAEALGYHSAWGNDHLNTPKDARLRYDRPPNVYEILITLATAATITKRIRLGVAALSLPLREPVSLAKQVATLDVFSRGRVSLAVGISHYREEFTSIRPRQKHSHRGEMFEEALEALHLLLTEETARFTGRHYQFEDISLHPKPLQDPLPIYITGTGPRTPERVVKWGTGWLLTTVSNQTLGERIEYARYLAEEADRDPASLEMAHTIALRVDPTHEQAEDRFKNSLLMNSPRGIGQRSYRFTRCVGTPTEVAERIREIVDEGVEHVIIQDFAVDSFEEMQEQVQFFGEEVLPLFS